MSGERRAPEEELPFEEAMEQLEEAVAALEGGDLPLEESLSRFEQGVRLVRFCSDRLKAAEIRIQQLEESSDGLRERTIEIEEE
jgi:exodeoxyribonuclease VII small subunit